MHTGTGTGSRLTVRGRRLLQFRDGDTWESLGIEGDEYFEIHGLDDGLQVNDELMVTARARRDEGSASEDSSGEDTDSRETDDDGNVTEFDVTAQVATPAGVRYVENSGILHTVLRRLLTE